MNKLLKTITGIFNTLDFKLKVFISKLMGKKYIRTGKCNACGRCCQHIYVRHAKHIIHSEEEFERLIPHHFFYSYLEIVDKTETGLVFKCKNLDEEKGNCKAYNRRALLCRQYPLEEIFMMGGTISENCGFKFLPLQKFEDVLKKLEKSKKIKMQIDLKIF